MCRLGERFFGDGLGMPSWWEKFWCAALVCRFGVPPWCKYFGAPPLVCRFAGRFLGRGSTLVMELQYINETGEVRLVESLNKGSRN